MKSITKKDIIFFISILITFYLIWAISDITFPFLAAIFIAYLLDPIVDILEKKINRTLAATLVIVLFFIFIVFISLLIFPILVNQIKEFIEKFPTLITEFYSKLDQVFFYIKSNLVDFSKFKFLKNFDSNTSDLAGDLINNIMTTSIEIFNIISLIIITPIVSWYLLKDWDKLSYSIKKRIPNKNKKTVLKYLSDIDAILSSYIRGQLLIGFILGIYYSISFKFLGLNYPLLLGIIAGFFSLIPFIGILLIFIFISLLTLLQFFNFMYIIYSIPIFIFAQLIEAYVLTPKLIGNKLGLHPVLIIFSIFAFGSLFGLVGILFAIPITSILILFLNGWIKNNKNGND